MWEPDQMTFCDHPVSYGPRVSFGFKGTPSIPETYLSSSVAWGLNLRVG